MDARHLKAHLSQALIDRSGLEQKRAYLGMSQIGRCPRQLYRMMIEGKSEAELSEQRHWYCWTGYVHEAAVVDLLKDKSSKRRIEIVADFDDRYRGHVDFVLDDDAGGSLLEIKSVSWWRFSRIVRSPRPDWLHYCQVQAYMRHGGYQRAFIVYLARDIDTRRWRNVPFWVFEVQYNVDRALALDEKAASVLFCVDNGKVIPECDCGHCD